MSEDKIELYLTRTKFWGCEMYSSGSEWVAMTESLKTS
jgi:hypothetical protein